MCNLMYRNTLYNHKCVQSEMNNRSSTKVKTLDLLNDKLWRNRTNKSIIHHPQISFAYVNMSLQHIGARCALSARTLYFSERRDWTLVRVFTTECCGVKGRLAGTRSDGTTASVSFKTSFAPLKTAWTPCSSLERQTERLIWDYERSLPVTSVWISAAIMRRVPVHITSHRIYYCECWWLKPSISANRVPL